MNDAEATIHQIHQIFRLRQDWQNNWAREGWKGRDRFLIQLELDSDALDRIRQLLSRSL